jgi:hypothetical protein
MKRLWDTMIEPILEATRPKSIVEIGSDEGLNTRNLLEFCERTDAVLHVIDPVPKYDVSEWLERYGERFVFYPALSLDVIPSLGTFDLVLVDGDHNWYTVYNELRSIEERCAGSGQPFPLVMLHDIDWPFGRRDLYYDPDTVPEAYRQPFGTKGVRPGDVGLCDEGGLIQGYTKAVHEGGSHNGVFTAVEDFLRETSLDLDLMRIPGFHGLGVLIPRRLRENENLVEVLRTWDLPPAVVRHIERLERTWLESEVRRHAQRARADKLRARMERRAESRAEPPTNVWPAPEN